MRNVILRVKERFVSISVIFVTAIFLTVFLLVEDELSFTVLMLVGGGLFYFVKRRDCFKEVIVFARQSRYGFLICIFLALLTVLIILRNEHFALFMIASVALYSTVCFGLTIQLGYAGLTNFAGAAFFGVGGYAIAVLSSENFPDILSVLTGGFMAALVGSVLILPILRTRGHYAALVTIAFALLFKTFLELNDTLGGPQGLKISSMNMFGWDFGKSFFGGSFYLNYVLFSLLVMVSIFTLTRFLEKSWIGLHWDALRIDEISSASFGINISSWKILAFTLGNFFIGLSGALYAKMLGHIAPTNFTFGDSLILISIVILGGIGNPWGVIPAAFLIIVLPEKLQFIQEYRLLLFALLVILVLLYRPDGLFKKALRSFYRGWGKV